MKMLRLGVAVAVVVLVGGCGIPWMGQMDADGRNYSADGQFLGYTTSTPITQHRADCNIRRSGTPEDRNVSVRCR